MLTLPFSDDVLISCQAVTAVIVRRGAVEICAVRAAEWHRKGVLLRSAAVVPVVCRMWTLVLSGTRNDARNSSWQFSPRCC